MVALFKKKCRKIGIIMNNPWVILIKILKSKVSIILPDKWHISISYYYYFKCFPNFSNPVTFNEKLQWLKLYDHNPLYIKLVDKYEIRKYIEQLIGREYLVPILGVWDNFDDIDFSRLPNQFVFKCTHDSGSVYICKDKNSLDIEVVKSRIKKALKYNFFYFSREWPYKYVKPRIICEEYLSNLDKSEIIDYKLMCFNGVVKCSFVCLNRFTPEGLNVDFYDKDWNYMEFSRHYKNSNRRINKPNSYNKMVQIAEILSKDIPFVRVDFYEVENKLYFGEMTFFPGAGFEEFTPVIYDKILGSWINLEMISKELK